MELGLHADDRADALALGAQLRVLDRPLLELLELELELQPAHAERHLDGRRQCRSSWISKLSTPGQQLRHLARVLEDVPHELRRGVELPCPFDFHVG